MTNPTEQAARIKALESQLTVLKQKEQRYRSLVENANDWFWEVNASGQYTYVSPNVEDILGYAPEDMLGKTPFALMLPEEAARMEETFGAIAGQQAPIHLLENTNLHKNGTQIVFETSGFPFYDDSGAFAGYRGIDRDITARKAEEQALRTSQEQLKLVVNNTPLVFFSLDSDGNFLLSEGQALAKLGLKPGQIVGMNVRDVYKDSPAILDEITRALTGEAFTSTLDLGPLAFHTTYTPLLDDEGSVSGVIGVSLDISERKATEERFSETEKMLRTIIDSVPGRVFWKDESCVYLGANINFARDCGFDSWIDVIGKTDYDFAHADQAPLYQADDKAVMESGEPRLNFEEPQTREDGSTYWIRTSKIPLQDDNGQVIGILGMYDDITEQKQAQEDREQLQLQIIEAQQQTLKELSTPIIPLLDRIIIMPLIGGIDTLRARDITRALLQGISQHRAEIVIVDITGVPVVDSGVAAYLNKTIMAARLKGARTVITGISDAVAETIVDLGIDWSTIDTLADLQTGLAYAIKQLHSQQEKQNNGGTERAGYNRPAGKRR